MEAKKLASSYKYKVSILIPMLNEEASIPFVLNRVRTCLAGIDHEIIVVDDGSTDSSRERVESFISLHPELAIRYVYQQNQGKGGAIRHGISLAQGEILVVQDADQEYNPADIIALLEPFDDGAKVVYGSRNSFEGEREHSGLMFYWGGLLVTWVTNFLFNAKLTDEATGYKLFHASLFDEMTFKHNDFAWEPEITAKILKRKIEIFEKPIEYHPRSKAEGKKISWKDGVKAIWVLFIEFLKP